MREAIEIEGRTLSLSNLDKVLYPATGFRKRDLIAYYRAVAPILLPHLADRALHLGRWPDGVEQPGWLQANCRGHPDWTRTHVVTGKRGQRLEFCVLDDVASLLWAANLGTIELHPFHATISRPDTPRAMVFDLDPGPGCSLQHCADAARELRAVLQPLHSFLKTSGVKGLHLFVPLNRDASFARVKAFARGAAAELAARHPGTLTAQMARSERAGRVFIDCSQNDPGKQTVAPYSLRATRVPQVSAPIAWDELDALARITPDAALDRIAHRGDLFGEVLDLQQSL